LELYNVQHWVVEDAGFQDVFTKDPRVRSFSKVHDVYFESHSTGHNKNHALYGVGAMTRLFKEELIDLPYGDQEARDKSNVLRKQLLNFTDAASGTTKVKSDVHMASWFPQKTIRRWEKEAIVAAAQAQSNNTPYPQSYAGLSGFTDLQKAPW
jgi:hypothetical protein